MVRQHDREERGVTTINFGGSDDISTDFNTPTTGFNARAAALAAAAVAAYSSPTPSAVAAVMAERGSLGAAIVTCLQGTGTGAGAAAGHDAKRGEIEVVHGILADVALAHVLPQKRDGFWTPADANGFSASAVTASAVAKIAALQSQYEAAGAA